MAGTLNVFPRIGGWMEGLNSIQKSFSCHKRYISIFRKQINRDVKGFAKEFFPCLYQILLVFKREPAVERLVQFIVGLLCLPDENNENLESLITMVVDKLLGLVDVKDKAVRFRSLQIIAGIVGSLEELESDFK